MRSAPLSRINDVSEKKKEKNMTDAGLYARLGIHTHVKGQSMQEENCPGADTEDRTKDSMETVEISFLNSRGVRRAFQQSS